MKITRSKLNEEWIWVDFEDDMTEIELEKYKRSLIPQSITPRQIRLALIELWFNLSDIDDLISSLEEPEKSIVRTMREYSISFERDDEYLIQFAKSMWISDEQLDWIFIIGSEK